jgi:hypothetical protein
MKNNIILYLYFNIIFQSIITLHQLHKLIFVEISVLITNSVGENFLNFIKIPACENIVV